MNSDLFDAVVNHLLNGGGSAQGGGKDRMQGEESEARTSTVPMDILEMPKEYAFYLDVPGLSKSDIQVTLEEGKVLVIKSNAKRKREEEEGCKYLRFERRGPLKFLRKFRLSEDANVEAISARCENGVLMVTMPKLLPEKKTKTVEVKVA